MCSVLTSSPLHLLLVYLLLPLGLLFFFFSVFSFILRPSTEGAGTAAGTFSRCECPGQAVADTIARGCCQPGHQVC